MAEHVEVAADVSKLQTDTPEVGTSLSNKELVDLPLSFSGFRSIEGFAYKISPGVSGNAWTSHVNGSTSFSKEVLLDGAPTTTYLAGDITSSSLSVEAIQEFKIQTGGVSAEYGRSQPGIFNYVMKSGSNEVHGSGFAAIRNEALDATSFANSFADVYAPVGSGGAVSIFAPVPEPTTVLFGVALTSVVAFARRRRQ